MLCIRNFYRHIDCKGLGLPQEASEHTLQSILISSGVNKLSLGVDKLNESGIKATKKPVINYQQTHKE
jgi:hypothetical protein